VVASASTASVIVAPPPITHRRYTSVAAPQFRECRQLSSSGETRRFLACDGAEVSCVPAPGSPASVIDVPSGGIMLVRRIASGKRVHFELDVPVAAQHWDGEHTDNLPSLPPSMMPAQPTRARKYD
jgi:hypothetical protein